MNKVNIEVIDLGVIMYANAYELQKKYVDKVLHSNREYLLLCEHDPVITFGRMSKQDHLLVSNDELLKCGVELVSIDRGGDITLHCPGQLIAYPILNLNNYKKDLHYYLHQLEEVLIELLKEFGIVAERSKRNTGAWIKNRKIASIGVGVKKWISYHGIGLNVNTPLEMFQLIKPCGLDCSMTSMREITGRDIDIEQVKNVFVEKFNSIFV